MINGKYLDLRPHSLNIILIHIKAKLLISKLNCDIVSIEEAIWDNLSIQVSTE